MKIKKIIKNNFIYKKMPNSLKSKIKNMYKNTCKNVNIDPVTGFIIDDYYEDKEIKPGMLKISFVIPQPIIGSGGHRNIYRIVRYLAAKGYDVTCYVDPEGNWDKNHVKTGKEAQSKIKDNFFDLGCNIVFNVNNIQPCDVLFATHSESAYIVQRYLENVKLACYFIQDYESYFFPMGDNYLRTHNTYKMGLYPITSGPWPLEMLKNNFGIKEGNYFRFPINTKVYYNNEKNRKENRIVFFAKPTMPRRCYNLGVSALEIVKKKHPELEIVFYGDKLENYVNVPFEFTNLGILPTIDDLADLYRSSIIGIAFSTTNPSLVPYEMMSCGCAVVDLDFNNSVVSYDSSENVMLVDTTPDKIAEGIIKLYEDKKYRKNQVKNGLNFCKKFPTEDKMCELIEKYILEQLKKRSECKK